LERTEVNLAANKPEEATDTVTREVARSFGVPISLVTVIESDAGFWHHSAGSTGNPFPEASPYSAVLAADELLVVEDVGKEERFADNPVLEKRGVRFFASAPLRLRDGHHVGNLCVLDTQPRTFGDSDRELLLSLAAQLMEALEPATAAASDHPSPPDLS
jgi:GAF domain-containing protein